MKVSSYSSRLSTDKLVCQQFFRVGSGSLVSATPHFSAYPTHASGSPKSPIRFGSVGTGHCDVGA